MPATCYLSVVICAGLESGVQYSVTVHAANGVTAVVPVDERMTAPPIMVPPSRTDQTGLIAGVVIAVLIVVISVIVIVLGCIL